MIRPWHATLWISGENIKLSVLIRADFFVTKHYVMQWIVMRLLQLEPSTVEKDFLLNLCCYWVWLSGFRGCLLLSCDTQLNHS